MNITIESRSKLYNLITRRLQEVLGGDIIKGHGILAKGRSPKAYWGTAATGRPHIGYVVPLTKIADFLRAGVQFSLVHVHAFLDILKAPLDLVTHRTIYYEFVLRAIFTSLGIPTSTLTFVRGSDYQFSREYNLDHYKLCTLATEHDAKKGGIGAGLIYPGLQALDEQYLVVDFQFGGVDQRKIFTYAELYLPILGYAGPFFGPAGSCEEKAFCEGCLCSWKAITREKGGGPSHYRTYQELEDDFAAKKIHPGDLKVNIRDAVILLEPIRAAFLANEEWQQAEQLAYPDPNARKKVKKKKKARKGKNATKSAPAPVDGAAVDERRVSDPPASQPDGEAVPA
ncbi:tRNA synthetases class I-domain-containing protein [Boletus edulis BED1]|uniref:tyrosine--tRNA ligase n=1 Tax=Boletus edulis BED1 TaxID=1328754 RepID=A0AAD4G9P7_BOLED|nr:tRNA synthetases class I-domain-containing protein [Boletus edulis BED1]